MGVRVFISYRRSDNRHLAGRLQDRLTDAFGDENVFFDVESIGFGHDFREVIRSTLQAVDVVVAVVGPGFSPDRLASPHDVVRMELAMAFDLAVPVIPVLVDNAEMPAPSALPPDLERFSYLHAAPLRPDPDFRPDCTRLITAIRELAGARRPAPAPPPEPPPPAEDISGWTPLPLTPDRPGRPHPEAGSGRRRALVDQPGPGIGTLAFSPDGSLLAAGDDRGVHLWEPATGRALRVVGTDGSPWDLAFSPNHRLLSIIEAGKVRTVDLDDGRQVRLTSIDGLAVRAIAFSPDGKLLAGCGRGTVVVWEPYTGRRHQQLTAEAGDVAALAFSPDGRLLASAGAGAETTVQVWQVGPWSRLFTADGHDQSVNSVAFSSDSRRLASAGSDRMVHLWATDDGHLVRSVRAARQPIRRVAFSPDGRLLATTATTTNVRLWDPRTGQRVAELSGHSVPVRDIAFSPDGSILATCGGTSHGVSRSELFLWDLT